MAILPAAAFGVGIGTALGLLGAGGSILAIPALVYGLGQPLSVAVPTSLVVVAVSAAGGLAARWRTKAIRLPVALVFAAASVPAAFAGTALGKRLPDRWLLVAFAVLMVLVAVRMLTGTAERDGACRVVGGAVNWRGCLPKALAVGAVVGVLAGMFGVGGGFVIVPALTMLLGLTAPEAVGTSLVIIVVTSLGALAAHAPTMPDLDYGVILVFAGAALAASLIAGLFGNRLPARTVTRAFAYVVLVVAVGVATTALLAPAALHGG
ncbi:sulfite exporter TauE/SafE family protein [Actinokineospora xionganensis]|uniref:Probable membrane transporter protein n=1 Tax=Actinokineospora xionganensis TaxID=2684470 RepID=A0ABR7KZX0_9PSEU|nr:sulfite exporter TauE/SafE family protein [Actinokineospora xionganensis]MBC6445920.1 sulfite exporter TauE/SafE family protein [Actinokineospora xionganensis]